MNNIVRLIFNEKIVEKRGLWVLSIVHGTHWNCVSVLKRASKKKKGKREVSAFQHYPNAHLICVWIEIILPTSVFFFFFDQRLLYCSWDMNSALRQMYNVGGVNSNPKIIFLLLFSTISFQFLVK